MTLFPSASIGVETAPDVAAPRRRATNRKTIRQPEPSEELAEFIGIFLGDGGFRNTWQVTISYNHRADRAYAEFIHALIRQLFGLEATWYIRRRWGCADLVISSTSLVEFLGHLGLPRGPKSTVITEMPEWIKASELYRIACLRGLMDTDGCVYQHRYHVNGKMYAYPKLCFAGSIPILCSFVKSCFEELNLSPYTHPNGKRVYVMSYRAVDKYFRLVGTHNPRYRKRFEEYARRGARAG